MLPLFEISLSKLVWLSVQWIERSLLRKGRSTHMLLSIAVIGYLSGFKLTSSASIRMNLRYVLHLFNCLRVIVFSTDCNALKTFNDRN